MRRTVLLLRTTLRGALFTLLVTGITAGAAFADGTLSGTVKDPGGAAVANAWVYVYDAQNKIYRARTGDDGTYSVEVPAGTYSVTAIAAGHQQTTLTNIAVADNQTVGQHDLQLKAAAPLSIVKAAAPIPLTAGIDAAEFADAPEIRLDQAWQVVVAEGDNAATVWQGPQTASGRFKMKYDATNLYVAADVTFAANRLNSQNEDPWQGNAIEFYLQNDPFDPSRTAYDPDHNWQLVVGLGPTPTMKLYGSVQAKPEVNLADVLLVTDKPDNKGVLVRANLPWSMFLKEDKTGITAPADESLGAIGIAINAANPASEPTSTSRILQLMFPLSNSNWTDPSGLQPVTFTAKAPQ